CLNSNNYDMAIHIFEELEDYKDASNQLLEAKYQKSIFMMENKEYDEAIDLFTEVANYKDSEIKLKNAKYEKALILVEEESHFTAINLFVELGDYKDAKEKVNSIRYEKALIFIKEGKYAEGYSLLQQAGMQEYVEQHIYGRAKIALDNKDYVKAYDLLKLANGYEDSEDLLVQIEPEYYANQLLEKMKKSGLSIAENYLSSIPKNNRNDECLYKLANEFYKNEKHKAYIIYEYLGDYKDSKKYAHNCSYHYEFSKKGIGAKIKFGTYEQDNNSKTKESLEWKICDIDDNRYLLVSSYCIDYKQFHNKFQDVTWEESDLRKWLNHSFYDQAFSKEEKDLVALSEIKTDMYRYSSEDLITQDKVFMLSHTELLEYTNGTKSIDVTTYAQEIYKNIESTNGNSVTENISNYQGYWVREPDIVNNSKWSYIELNHVLSQGKPVNEYYYVRPAIWVEIK
ncbi:MAG: hypothetical protein IKY26_10475, partial [Erysipelotrichaceae bacterium]|nr:hypothetical protein [Erysipelotrichaceae bacterium]